MTEAHALDADVLGEQQRPERALDECDRGQRRGEMPTGRRQDRGLAHLAADLDPEAGGDRRGGNRQRGSKASTLRDPHVEEIGGPSRDQLVRVRSGHERFVDHDRDRGGVPQPGKLSYRAARQRLLDRGDAEMRDRVQDFDGPVEAPRAVDIEPERGLRPQSLAHGRDPRDVVVGPDLQLDGREADRPHLPRELHGSSDRSAGDDAAIGHAIPTGWQHARERSSGAPQRAVEDGELERRATRVRRDDSVELGLGQELADRIEVVDGRQLPVRHPGPELVREMGEHHFDGLAGDVRAGCSFAVPLGPGVVAHTHHDRVGAAPFGGAVTERLHERDPERVERGRHESHRRPPAAFVAAKSRKYRRAKTFSRSVISTMVNASSSANS